MFIMRKKKKAMERENQFMFVPRDGMSDRSSREFERGGGGGWGRMGGPGGLELC